MKDLTKEQAEKIIKDHLSTVAQLMMIWSLDALNMAVQGEAVEKALSIPGSDLAKALGVPSTEMRQASSNYMTVLENALKGQLNHVTEEWEDTIG